MSASDLSYNNKDDDQTATSSGILKNAWDAVKTEIFLLTGCATAAGIGVDRMVNFFSNPLPPAGDPGASIYVTGTAMGIVLCAVYGCAAFRAIKRKLYRAPAP